MVAGGAGTGGAGVARVLAALAQGSSLAAAVEAPRVHLSAVGDVLIESKLPTNLFIRFRQSHENIGFEPLL